MTSERTPQLPRLTLGASSGLGRVRVSTEGFFDFSFWLAEELEDLIRRHPKSDRPRSERLLRQPRPHAERP